MSYIVHRKINQAKTGRRLLQNRRIGAIEINNERRTGLERRLIADRRKSND
ncbi:MAG: hypothetical protein ACPHLK_10400 [Gammaproteobacteria bacterium]